MVDTVNADSSQSATDLQAEWDRLDAAEGGQSERTPEEPQAEERSDPQDDQGQASRPPAEPAAATPPAGNEPPANDLWANAPPELKAAYEADKAKWEQTARSQGGRAQAEARRAAELAADLDALRKQQQPAAEAEEATPALTDEAIKALREEYPDVAAPLLDVIAGLEKKVTQLAASDASREERQAAANQLQQAEHAAAEEQRLTEAHSDWQTVAGSQAFADWIKTQPRLVQDGLQRNANQIVDADEAGYIISQFKATLPAGDGLQARREAQMQGSRVPQPRAVAPTPSTTSDKEAEWNKLDALDRQRETQRAGARSTR